MVAVASGLVLFLAFPDVGWWVTAPVAFAAFYMLLARVSTRGGFGFGWIMGMAFFLPHLWWAYVAVGPVPWIALSGGRVDSIWPGRCTVLRASRAPNCWLELDG